MRLDKKPPYRQILMMRNKGFRLNSKGRNFVHRETKVTVPFTEVGKILNSITFNGEAPGAEEPTNIGHTHSLQRETDDGDKLAAIRQAMDAISQLAQTAARIAGTLSR